MFDLNEVQPGDDLTADILNAMIRKLASLPDATAFPRSNTILLARNDTGLSLDRFAVVGVKSVVPTPAADLDHFVKLPILLGMKPDMPSQAGKWGITQDPADPDDVVHTCIAGITAAKINVTNASHGYAEAEKNNTTTLISGHQGSAQILYKQSGTGIRWAIIRIGTGSESQSTEFWAQILGYEACSKNKWRYLFQEVEYRHLEGGDEETVAGWCEARTWVTGGRIGLAMNTVEVINAPNGAGMTGIGVDLTKCGNTGVTEDCSSSSGTTDEDCCECFLLPVGTGAIVRMYEEEASETGSSASSSGEGPAYWFQFENEYDICSKCDTLIRPVFDVYCSEDGTKIIVCTRDLLFNCRGQLKVNKIGPLVCDEASSSSG